MIVHDKCASFEAQIEELNKRIEDLKQEIKTWDSLYSELSHRYQYAQAENQMMKAYLESYRRLPIVFS